MYDIQCRHYIYYVLYTMSSLYIYIYYVWYTMSSLYILCLVYNVVTIYTMSCIQCRHYIYYVWYTIVLLYILCLIYNVVTSFVAATFYKMFGGEQWKSNVLCTALLVPGTVFMIFFVLNLLLWFVGVGVGVGVDFFFFFLRHCFFYCSRLIALPPLTLLYPGNTTGTNTLVPRH